MIFDDFDSTENRQNAKDINDPRSYQYLPLLLELTEGESPSRVHLDIPSF
jgi:hypothetical protein